MMLNKERLKKIEVIYDRDHGPANEGWYVRLHVEGDLDGRPYKQTYDFNPGTDPSPKCRDRRKLERAGRREARANGYAVRGVPVVIID